MLGFHARPVRAQRRVERDLGEVGHRAGDLRERREPGEVARRDPQHHPRSQLAQRGPERRRLERIARRQERTHVGRGPPLNARRLDLVGERRARGEQALREARPAECE